MSFWDDDCGEEASLGSLTGVVSLSLVSLSVSLAVDDMLKQSIMHSQSRVYRVGKVVPVEMELFCRRRHALI